MPKFRRTNTHYGPRRKLRPTDVNYVYIIAQVVRVDMREILTMAAGERATTFDGLQVRPPLSQETFKKGACGDLAHDPAVQTKSIIVRYITCSE